MGIYQIPEKDGQKDSKDVMAHTISGDVTVLEKAYNHSYTQAEKHHDCPVALSEQALLFPDIGEWCFNSLSLYYREHQRILIMMFPFDTIKENIK